MFDNEKEMIQAMTDDAGQLFEYAGGEYVCKFDPTCIRGSREYSPFVWRPKVPNMEEGYSWRAMNISWQHYHEMRKVTPDLPDLTDLPIDTKVFVKESGQNFWFKRHFKEWNGSKIVCFGQGDTSFTESDPTDTGIWEVWEIAEGEFKGKTNCKQE